MIFGNHFCLPQSPNKSIYSKRRTFAKYSSAVFAFLMLTNLAAQNPSRLEMLLNKENISWIWEGNLFLSTQAWRHSRVRIDNKFSSNLYSETFQKNRWKDENNFKMSWSYPLSDKIQTSTLIDSRIFSDENTNIEFNKHVAAQELSLNFHPKISIKPALGWTVEEIYGRQDQGWYSKLGLEINKLDMGGYLNTTDANSVIRDFPGRKNQEHTFFTGWVRQFSDRSADSVRVGYQYSENRYYLSQGSNNLEEVIINARFLNNQLTYQTGDASRFSIMTEFKNRQINQSNPTLVEANRRKEIFISNQFSYLFRLGPVGANWGVLFSQTINDNPGEQTDIDGLQAALTSSLEFRPSKRDVLWSRFSYTKYEYNTPEKVNDDDRDEQRFIIDTSYRHRFSRFFELNLKSQVYLYHQIFLSADRSENNNWNRIYQLAAGFDHRLSERIRHNHQIKILANYTVFDFDEILPTIRSYVFRKLIYTDSTSIQLTENLYLNTIYQWEDEDNGTFFKNEYSQQVSKQISTHFLNVSLQHQKVLGFHLTTGITYYWRDEWTFIPKERKVREFRSLSPRIALLYPASNKLLLYGIYAPNRTTDFGENRQYFVTGKLNVQYFF